MWQFVMVETTATATATRRQAITITITCLVCLCGVHCTTYVHHGHFASYFFQIYFIQSSNVFSKSPLHL